MNAIILAAGLGTRLGALGKRYPKILLGVNGKTLLERHLDYLETQDVDRVIITAFHRAEQIKAFVNGYTGPLDIVCLEQETSLGTAGGVYNALELLGSTPFLVLYGDIVYSSFGNMLDSYKGTTLIAVQKMKSVEGKGVVEIDKQGRVIEFIEKSLRSKDVFTNSGIYILNEQIVPLLRPHADFGYDIFPEAIKRGIPISAHRISPVIDIGTPEGLAQVRS